MEEIIIHLLSLISFSFSIFGIICCELTLQLLEPAPKTAQEPDSDDDDTYWNQYDQTTGRGLSETTDTPNIVPNPRGCPPSAYFDQYDNIETTITDAHFMHAHAGPRVVSQAQTSGDALRKDRNEELDIGLEEYIRTTLQNLSKLAVRSGMSKSKFAAIIQQSLG